MKLVYPFVVHCLPYQYLSYQYQYLTALQPYLRIRDAQVKILMD